MDTRGIFFFVLVLGMVHCKLTNLSCKDIKTFVDGHNSRRLQLAQGKVPGQPAASKMNSMVWDEELAKKAAEWAKKGKNSHNPLRTVGSGRFAVGENIYMHSTTAKKLQLDFNSLLDSWFKEHKNYKFTPLDQNDFKKTGDQQIGHYTQMAWSNTVYVGCAISKVQEGIHTKHYAVCNYGPAGNYIGQTPYKRGSPSGRLDCGAKSCSKPYGPSC